MVILKNKLSDNRLRASKMLACALHAESVDIWSEAAIVWRKRLTDAELAVLSYGVLRAMEPDQAVMVVEAVFDSPDMPMVPLFSAMHEAACWADWADYDLVEACTLAGFNRLTPGDQADFLRYVTAREAA
jgi:hypothetical protein